VASRTPAALAAAGLPVGICRTTRIPLVGAASRATLSIVDAPNRLVARYGTEAVRVAAPAELDRELAAPVYPGGQVTAAEVVWAVRNEGALDVLDRRTRIGLVDADRAAAEPVVTELVARTMAGITAN
jgi:glycerol-3-phosphate dehydrogenase